MSYGPDDIDEVIARSSRRWHRQSSRASDPSELPVVQPTKFELVINLKTAKVLSLYHPSAGYCCAADEVIQ